MLKFFFFFSNFNICFNIREYAYMSFYISEYLYLCKEQSIHPRTHSHVDPDRADEVKYQVVFCYSDVGQFPDLAEFVADIVDIHGDIRVADWACQG